MTQPNHIKQMGALLDQLAGLHSALSILIETSHDDPVDTCAIEALLNVTVEKVVDIQHALDSLSLHLASELGPAAALQTRLDELREAREGSDQNAIYAAERALCNSPTTSPFDALHKIFGLGCAQPVIPEMDRHMWFSAMEALKAVNAIDFHIDPTKRKEAAH